MRFAPKRSDIRATQHIKYHVTQITMSTTRQEASEQQQQQTTTRTSPNDHGNTTSQLPARDQVIQDQSKDKSQVSVSTASTTSHQGANKSQCATSPSSAPVSAAAVNAIMGPPPPKDEKTGSRWERWRRDRKEAKEMGMPSQESSGRWGVKNFAA